jgi:hypothetical protein
VYALRLSRDLAYIVGVAPINSTLCNTFHQIVAMAMTKSFAICKEKTGVTTLSEDLNLSVGLILSYSSNLNMRRGTQLNIKLNQLCTLSNEFCNVLSSERNESLHCTQKSCPALSPPTASHPSYHWLE